MRGYVLYILLRGLRLVALGLAVGGLSDLAGLALALQVAHLADEDRVDLEQRGDAVLGAGEGDGRHGRGGHGGLDGRLGLRGLGLDLGHGLRLRRRLAVGGEGGARRGLLVHLGHRIGLAVGARGRGGLAVRGKLLVVGGRGQGLGVGRGRVGVLYRGCSMAWSAQHSPTVGQAAATRDNGAASVGARHSLTSLHASSGLHGLVLHHVHGRATTATAPRPMAHHATTGARERLAIGEGLLAVGERLAWLRERALLWR
jgi:hypothetical protein